MSTRGHSSPCTSIQTFALQERNGATDQPQQYMCFMYHVYINCSNYANFNLPLLVPPQTRHQQPNHAKQHASCVGEDELQLAGSGSLPLDPGGASSLPRQGFQLNMFSCLHHIYSIVWLLTLHRKYYGIFKVRFNFFAFVSSYLFYGHGADLSVITCADIDSVRKFFFCLFMLDFGDKTFFLSYQ